VLIGAQLKAKCASAYFLTATVTVTFLTCKWTLHLLYGW